MVINIDLGANSSHQTAVPSTSVTNVIRQGSKALPTSTDSKNAKGTIDKERIVDINSLNPYMNKFV